MTVSVCLDQSYTLCFVCSEGCCVRAGDYKMPTTHKRTNPLLVRPVVGQVKATTYNLPGDDYVYGKVDNGDEEGAREGTPFYDPHTSSHPSHMAFAVVNSWRQHTPESAARPARDFVRLNQHAAMKGAVTSKHISTLSRFPFDCTLHTIHPLFRALGK
jgi:hypothetical protein